MGIIESLEKATEERLDAEKALQALQAEKEEQEQRARRDIEGLQNLVASLEKQNAELEGNLISQADAFRQERSELDAAKAALHRDLEARGAALTELQAQHSGLISAHAELQTSNQTLSAQLEHLVLLRPCFLRERLLLLLLLMMMMNDSACRSPRRVLRWDFVQKEHEAESKSKLEEELSKVIAAKEALEENLRTLHQRFDDAELERKIAERKTQQMVSPRARAPSSLFLILILLVHLPFYSHQIKELKNQLAKERAKLQKGAGTITPSPSPLPSPASSPRLHVDGASFPATSGFFTCAYTLLWQSATMGPTWGRPTLVSAYVPAFIASSDSESMRAFVQTQRDLALSSPSVADDGGGQRVKAEWQKRCELLEQQMAALQQEKEQAPSFPRACVCVCVCVCARARA